MRLCCLTPPPARHQAYLPLTFLHTLLLNTGKLSPAPQNIVQFAHVAIETLTAALRIMVVPIQAIVVLTTPVAIQPRLGKLLRHWADSLDSRRRPGRRTRWGRRIGWSRFRWLGTSRDTAHINVQRAKDHVKCQRPGRPTEREIEACDACRNYRSGCYYAFEPRGEPPFSVAGQCNSTGGFPLSATRTDVLWLVHRPMMDFPDARGGRTARSRGTWRQGL